MKAVAYYQSLPAEHPEALQEVQLDAPSPGPHDLLVEVRAISVNPVDTKIRRNVAPENGAAKVLGWDAAGVVQAVGSEVSLFQPCLLYTSTPQRGRRQGDRPPCPARHG